MQPEGWINRLEDGTYEVAAFEQGKPANIKRFTAKRIYLPDEEAQYITNETLHGPDVIRLGITGWTKPPTYYADRYGTSQEPKIYEMLAMRLVLDCVDALTQHCFTVDMRHGASNAGVDAAVMDAMGQTGLHGSGINCPAYMPWVEDNERGGAVLVAASKDAYHAAYSRTTDILLVTGGRDAAFHHDYLKRLSGRGYSIVADLIQTVSTGLVPGMDIPPGKSDLQIGNAAAHVREKNCFYGPVPRTYPELAAITRLLVVDAAHKVHGRTLDTHARAALQDMIDTIQRTSCQN